LLFLARQANNWWLMKDNRFRILMMVLVALLALATRLQAVQNLPIDIDEPAYLNASLGYAGFLRAADWKGLAWYDENAEHPPLAKLIYAAALLPLPPIDQIQEKDLVAGSPVSRSEARGWLLRGRTVSLVFGVMAAVLLAWVNPAAGFLLAVQTSAVRYTSQVVLEAFPALTSFLCIWAYGKWSRKPRQEKITLQNEGWLVLSAVMLGLTAASKYMYCVAGLAVLLHLVWHGRRQSWPIKRLCGLILAWGGLALLVFFVSDPYLWPRPLSRLLESVQYHFAFASSEHVARYQYPFWQPLIYLSRTAGQASWYWLALDLPILLLAVLGLRRMWQEEPLYGLWLGVALIFLLVWRSKWPQYVMILIVPWCLAAGLGLRTLWDWGMTRFKPKA
jgi:hypothetical protein